MANEILNRDQNHITVLGGVTDNVAQDVTMLRVDPTTKRLLISATGLPGGGTVTSVSVVTANGFAGSVATATSTPAITLSTTVTGLLKGNGTVISAATAGTDYVTASSTNTFTNKTYDTAGSGNAFAINGSSITAVTGTGAVVLATSPTLVTPALGTPSAVVLTNATGLPVAGIVSSTATALGVGSLELGNASDTTLARSSAGVLAVEGVVIPSLSSTSTLTNKRITRRSATTNAPGATPTTNSDNVDLQILTGLATAITSMTTNLSGTPVTGDLLEFWFTDNGTARSITWGASFAATTVTIPTTTVISTKLRVLFEWGGSTWDCLATA